MAAPAAVRGRLLQLDWYDGFGVREAGAAGAFACRRKLAAEGEAACAARLANPGPWDGADAAGAHRGDRRDDPDDALRLMSARGVDAWRERMSARIARSVPAASSRFVRALAGRHACVGRRGLGKAAGRRLDPLDRDLGSLASGWCRFFAVLGRRVLPRIGHVTPRPVAMAWAALLGGLVYAAVAGFGLPTMRTVLMIAVVAWRVPRAAAWGCRCPRIGLDGSWLIPCR
jgi:competence protein ComEC